MFCPKCRCEYRPGFKLCVDCNIDLVESLPLDESIYKHKHRVLNKKFKLRTRTKYYLFNSIWGFLGGFFLISVTSLAISQNTLLPPEMRLQNQQNDTNILMYFLLGYFLIPFIINPIGLFKYLRQNTSKNKFTWDFTKIILLNIVFLIVSLTSSIILTEIFFTF